MKASFVHLLAELSLLALLSALFAAKPASAAEDPAHGAAIANYPEQYGCSYAAHFVTDVTIPDDTVFDAGASFVKTWRIRNDGSCTWGQSYPLHSLVFVGGTNLANGLTFPILSQVAPGQQVDVSIPMTAAIYPGTYISQWKLKVDDGRLVAFGAAGLAPIYVQIIVRADGESSSGGCSDYIVQRGDWIALIAMRFGTTWQAIAQANNLYNPNSIYVGMRLTIPCGSGVPVPGGYPAGYTSNIYHYAVTAPAGWTVSVNTSIPAGPGSNPEHVTFSSPSGSLPQIYVDVLTGTPPYSGYENCDKNLVFRGFPACMLSMPRGQNPAQHLLILQRGNAYYHIAMLYEGSGEMADWDSFLRSWSFTD